ncbi:MAG: carbonic anhydrase [Planctomycetes bacterium]|nr:carbonic anhydrase [Planctomycetota bacterium]
MSLLRTSSLASLLFVAACASLPDEATSVVATPAPFERLAAGNRRFAEGVALGFGRDPQRRTEVAKAQRPFAIVVTCSDSRVCPELLFDAGLGDLFVVRTAGHVLDDHALGSIEYAAEHLGAHALLVVGHERCGAVAAAMGSSELPGHIESLATAIRPAIAPLLDGRDAADACVAENVRATVAALRESGPILHELVEAGTLEVKGGVYDLDTGVVEFVETKAAGEH